MGTRLGRKEGDARASRFHLKLVNRQNAKRAKKE
jgi:hypothetical protein